MNDNGGWRYIYISVSFTVSNVFITHSKSFRPILVLTDHSSVCVYF